MKRLLIMFAVGISGCVVAPEGVDPTPKAPVKRALLIGINAYPQSPLAGCINDVADVEAVLKARGGWEITNLRDKAATAKAIRAAARKIRLASRPGDEIYFHFSGHGTQINDPSEQDGYDEAICPVDVFDDFRGRCVTGREFRKWLAEIPTGVRTTVVLDSCHSGTRLRQIGEIANRHLPCPAVMTPLPQDRPMSFERNVAGSVTFWAACQASQTAADASFGRRPNGAFTKSLPEAGAYRAVTIQQADKNLRLWLRRYGFDQLPLLLAPQSSLKLPLLR